MQTTKSDTKKVFLQLGTCSQTFCYLLDRAFDAPDKTSEQAVDPLAGGIMRKGHQCGMLWGSSLAAGAEACRRCSHKGQAARLAISTTQALIKSFLERTGTVNCREITETDFSKKWDMFLYMLFKARGCFNLAEEWAPEAIHTALEELSGEPESDANWSFLNCASEVVRKMGGSEDLRVRVAGFAGGLGLSGHACGALSAAIWMNSRIWAHDHPGKSLYDNPAATRILEVFLEETGAEMLCHRITGRTFNDLQEHTDYISAGGCEKLLNALAGACADETNR